MIGGWGVVSAWDIVGKDCAARKGRAGERRRSMGGKGGGGVFLAVFREDGGEHGGAYLDLLQFSVSWFVK